MTTRWDVLSGREESQPDPKPPDQCQCCGQHRSDFKVDWDPIVVLKLDIVPGFQKTLCLCHWCHTALYHHYVDPFIIEYHQPLQKKLDTIEKALKGVP